MKVISANKLLILAIAVFCLAQFLPAIDPDMGAWNNDWSRPMPGFVFTLLVWPYYGSALLLLLGPLLVRLIGRMNRARSCFMVLIGAYVLTPISAIAWRDSIKEVSIGFFLWIATYCLAAWGTLLAMQRKAPGQPSGADHS